MLMFLCSSDVFHHYGNDWPLFRNWILYPIISATVFCIIGLAKMIELLRKVFATIWGMDIKGKSHTFKKSAYLGEASI